jgi:hypothetical protein
VARSNRVSATKVGSVTLVVAGSLDFVKSERESRFELGAHFDWVNLGRIFVSGVGFAQRSADLSESSVAVERFVDFERSVGFGRVDVEQFFGFEQRNFVVETLV